jgi:protein involved in polysaccharide export with SLBB domain
MTKKLLAFIFLSGTLCAAQSVSVPSATGVAVATTPGSASSAIVLPVVTTPVLSAQATEAERGTAPPQTSPARVAGPLTTRSDFETFAEDAAGAPLLVYGRQLFDQVPTTFAPMDRIPVPVNYTIGPGDQLLIRVWGKIDLDTAVTVDRNGQIFIPKVGTLSVAGLRFEQLEDYLQSAIAKLYKGFELNVTMGQLRSIQIFVLGSARQPGAYTVSSLSTLVNALFASGGPSAAGSMRHIQLRRVNQLVTDFDIYDLLRRGDKSHDVQLLPGDVIYILPVGPQIAMMGSVNDPGIYELNGETTIAAALKDAGGLTNLAASDRVLLERIEDHRRRRVSDFPLDVSGLQHVLTDGDLLRIFPISPHFDNAVTIRGNVAQPGRYTFHEGMKVSDLIPSREFLITRDHWNQQNHVAGAAHLDMMADLSLNSAEINWDYAAIERLDDQDLSTRLIAFNLGNAIATPESADNKVLKAGDVITIFSSKDISLPVEKRAAFVRLGGEIEAPGVYRVNPGDTLQSIVQRAGGLAPHAYLFASQLTRVSTRQAQEEQLRLSIAQMQRDLVSRYSAASSLSSTTAAEQQVQLSAQQSALAQLSTLHPTGRIVLGIRSSADSVTDIPNLPLEDGDSFFIPSRLSTVQVTGAVYNETALRYMTGKSLAAYLNDAGGPTRQADANRIYLIRADGTVVSRQTKGTFWRTNFAAMKLLPGDSIIVPNKLKSPGGFWQTLPYITQILSQTALTGAIVGTSF